MTKFRKGFMRVAREIVYAHPGLTGEDIAAEALRLDPSLSAAKEPVRSLAETLAKQVRDGKEPTIQAIGDYPVRYHPKTGNSGDSQKMTAPEVLARVSVGKPERIAGPGSLILTAGDSNFRGPLTKENIDLAIGLLKQIQASI